MRHRDQRSEAVDAANRGAIAGSAASAITGGAAPPLAGSGTGEGDLAVEQAIAAAVGRLGGANPELVLVFPSPALPAGAVADQIAAAAPGCAVAGMTSDISFTERTGCSRGCSAVAFGPDVQAGVGIVRDASRDLRAAGRAAVEAAGAGIALQPGHAVILLFLDPASGDEAAAIDGAYGAVGGSAPLAGGGANGAVGHLIAGEAVARDAVVAVALSSRAPIGVALAHGCHVRGVPTIATRSDGRAVRELDGRPAAEAYLEGLGMTGQRLDPEAFETLAVLHPLAQRTLRGELRLRHVIGLANGGGLACATTIPANAAVWFTEQTPDSIIASSRAAVRAARQPLPAPPRAGLIFECAARKRALGDRLGDNVAALRCAFGDAATLAGGYTRGEIARTRGAKGDRNHVIVAVAFC
jgi:hypothetical protein